MDHHIAFVTQQIQAADRLPGLMTAAFAGLELVERAATALSEIAPEASYPAYETALNEASDAWWALTEAPGLSWSKDSTLASGQGHREFAESVATLVTVVAQALLTGAAKTTDAADRTACMKAAHHAARVHAALK